MADADTRSLQEIKRETEQTRAGLTNTVEQLKTSVAETASDLRHRISPDAIKAEVSDYIRSRGEQLMDDVSSAARRNPMQAVAVGAGVAYPLLKLARAIPFPVLMVGAGLFFAGSKTGQAASQKASDIAAELSEEMVRRAHDLSDQMQDAASSAKNFASDQYDRISSAVADGSRQLQGAANSAGATIASGSEKMQAARFVTDTGMEAARTLKAKASDASERAGKTVFQTIEQHPLLVAGVGLLVGGLIASALPRSQVEDDLVGESSSAAKRKMHAAASTAFDTAKTAASEVYDETSRQAESEGLTTEGIGKAAQDLTQRVRRVAEAAVNTAFDNSKENHQPSPRGENDHG